MKRLVTTAAARGLALLALAGLSACGTPLIGGECAEGYTMIDGQCTAACRPGFERRDGFCRLAAGEVVILGLDYAEAQPGDSAGQILGNAVFLPDHQPVRILDYRELSAWNSSSVSNTVDMIAAEAVERRRTMTTHVASDAADVAGSLDIGKTDVFIVHDADLAPPGKLAELGKDWSAAIDAFLQQRGVVVVLAGAGGTHEMGAFLDASGLLVGAEVQPSMGDALYVADAEDMLSRGLPERIASTPLCASFALPDGADPEIARVVLGENGDPVVLRHARAIVGDDAL